MPTRPNRGHHGDDADAFDDLESSGPGDDEIELPEPMSDADYDELIASDPAIAADAFSSNSGGSNEAVLRRRRRALFAIVLALLLAFGGGLYALL